MKRILITLLTVLLTFSTLTTSFAFDAEDPYAQILLKRGYTEDDIIEINAILALSDADVVGLVVQKYEKLGDWKKVRGNYGIDESVYENYMEGLKMWQEVLDAVPENIISEMKEIGWKQHEINTFVNKINLSHIDYEYAWEEYKKGRNIDDIVSEKASSNDAKSVLDTKFVDTEMTDEEYISELLKIPYVDKNNVDVLLEEAKSTRNKMHNLYKKMSGITDEEIVYCKKQGITNPMDIYQAKMIASGNNLLLEDVVHTYLHVKSWSITVIELTNITPEEYIEITKDSIDDPAKEKEKIKEIEDYYFSTDKSNSDTTEIDIKDYTALYVGSNNAYINGKKKLLDEENTDVSVYVDDSRSYVPVRFISEKYGGKVEWLEETQTVNIQFDDRKISLTIGKPEITVNGKTTPIDVSPVLENGRTFLPLRACVDALGKEVFYSNGLILISDNPNTLDETEDADKINAVIDKYFK